MNLKEWAEKNGHTLAEAKELTGLTHWKQEVPESCDEIPEVAETVIETKSKEETVTEPKKELQEEHDLKLIELSIRGAGVKSPYWELRHLVGK